MAVNKKYIIAGSVLLGGVVIYGTFTKIRANTIENNILDQLKQGANQYGTLEDFVGFKGKVYQDSVPKTLNIIKLTDQSARALAARIKNAWGITDDDEEAIYQVFREIKDQYELSQVASAYKAVYTDDLLGKLHTKLSGAEQDVIYKIGKLYKPYRVSA